MLSKRFRRWLTALVASAVLLTTALSSGGAHTSSAAGTAPQVQSDQFGISAGVAAAALNRMEAAHHTSRPMVKVYFILNWEPNVEFAGLWVAEQYGWWRKAGIRISYEPYGSSVHPETDVPARGGNTFGFQSGAAIAIAKAQHVPIEALYTDTQRSVFGLTVLASSKIHKITDLRGKRVGYQPHELFVPETMLAYAHLKPTDWKPVPVLFDIAQLTSGQVDAFLTFQTNEPIALKLNGVATRSFKAADYGFHFYDDVLFSSTSLINGNPTLVRHVVSVAARGFKWAHSHPDQAARLTVRTHFPASGGISAQKNLLQQIKELQTYTAFSRDAHGSFSGTMTAKYWQDGVDTLYRFGLIHTKPSVSSLFTNKFNPYK